jgi:hypothetical protein
MIRRGVGTNRRTLVGGESHRVALSGAGCLEPRQAVFGTYESLPRIRVRCAPADDKERARLNACARLVCHGAPGLRLLSAPWPTTAFGRTEGRQRVVLGLSGSACFQTKQPPCRDGSAVPLGGLPAPFHRSRRADAFQTVHELQFLFERREHLPPEIPQGQRSEPQECVFQPFVDGVSG